MIPNGYTVMIDADECQHRRHVRWVEVRPTARLPEQLWHLRWESVEHCAVAVPDKAHGPNPRFRPCGMKRCPKADICAIHARKERHPR